MNCNTPKLGGASAGGNVGLAVVVVEGVVEVVGRVVVEGDVVVV